MDRREARPDYFVHQMQVRSHNPAVLLQEGDETLEIPRQHNRQHIDGSLPYDVVDQRC